MADNPYQAPTTLVEQQVVTQQRSFALTRIRIVLAVLAIGAVHNFACMTQMTRSAWTARLPWFLLMWVVVVIIAAAIAVVVLWLLEVATHVLHRLFPTKREVTVWRRVLYRSTTRAVPLSIAGAVLWVFWNHAFYHWNWNFYRLSVPVGIVAHALAAAWYVPLFVTWFRMEWSQKKGPQPDSESHSQ